MKIYAKSKTSCCEFQDLKKGKAFIVLGAPQELFIKTDEVHEAGVIYNSVRVRDGAMLHVYSRMDVERPDAFVFLKR